MLESGGNHVRVQMLKTMSNSGENIRRKIVMQLLYATDLVACDTCN